MLIILITLLLSVVVVGPVVAIFLVRRWYAREKAEIADTLREFVTAASEEEPSPLAQLADHFATVLAGRMWQCIEARLRGNAAAVASADKGEIESEVAGSSPLAALAMAFLPAKMKGRLIKNPQFIGALANMLMSKGAPGGAPGGDNNGKGAGPLEYK